MRISKTILAFLTVGALATPGVDAATLVVLNKAEATASLIDLDTGKVKKTLQTWGSLAPNQVNVTECLLSDIAENAVSFSYQRAFSFARNFFRAFLISRSSSVFLGRRGPSCRPLRSPALDFLAAGRVSRSRIAITPSNASPSAKPSSLGKSSDGGAWRNS